MADSGKSSRIGSTTSRDEAISLDDDEAITLDDDEAFSLDEIEDLGEVRRSS